MSHSGDELVGPAKQHSGWLIPLAVFFVTACLSALMLAYYFGPAPPGRTVEQPAPTDATRQIALSLGTVRFHIPANYIAMASQRSGGPVHDLSLIATLPDLQGYTLDAAPDLTANGPESRVINIMLKTGKPVLLEQERIDRIYQAQLEDPKGKPGPYGLQQYAFRADSGYHDQDLFVGTTESGPAVFLCSKLAPDVASPNCLRDLPMGELSLSYRFKRGHLGEWRKIDTGIRARIASFTNKD
ncbi:MAG TPA: hypothetical protein VNH44_14085 [Micropepsaceae bacterium]|nr:hypothetical protein [Micropepsaceae bacterium]